jgi:hypothetical protein
MCVSRLAACHSGVAVVELSAPPWTINTSLSSHALVATGKSIAVPLSDLSSIHSRAVYTNSIKLPELPELPHPHTLHYTTP